MHLTAQPIVNPAVLFREIPIDEWAVLFNPDNFSALSLNPTGVVVWKLIDGRRNIQDIVMAVKAHFKNVPESVTDDVVGLLEILSGDGYVGYEVAA
jgi:hypothetical protein